MKTYTKKFGEYFQLMKRELQTTSVTVFITTLIKDKYAQFGKELLLSSVLAFLIVCALGYSYNNDYIETKCAFNTEVPILGHYATYTKYDKSIEFNNTNYIVDSTSNWTRVSHNTYFTVIDSCTVFITSLHFRKLANSNELKDLILITNND